MSNDDFERRLHRLFAQAPAMPDETTFAARVHDRLDQGQSLRRVVIGLVGGLGAVIAVGQILSANLSSRVSEAGVASRQALSAGWTALTRDASGLLAAAPVPTELIWTAAGLGAAAIALLATRLADPY